MVTQSRGATWRDRPIELYGLSTDKKPTQDVPNGSVFHEMDTKKNYRFDIQNRKWHNAGSEDSGGNSGSGSDDATIPEIAVISDDDFDSMLNEIFG